VSQFFVTVYANMLKHFIIELSQYLKPTTTRLKIQKFSPAISCAHYLCASVRTARVQRDSFTKGLAALAGGSAVGKPAIRYHAHAADGRRQQRLVL